MPAGRPKRPTDAELTVPGGAMWMLRRQTGKLRYGVACAALLLMPAMPAVTVPAATQPAGRVRPDRLARLIRQLGSEKWAQREAAQEELIKVGWAAVPALRAAREHKDPEVARRAANAAEEIERRIEARRVELRGSMDEGYFSVPKADYLALLALPEPPLRDCYPASFVFRQQKDWPSLAKALEAAGRTLRRVMRAPPEQFVKATTDVPPRRGIRQIPGGWQTPNSYVYVQEDLDGRWRLRQGTVQDWLPVLGKRQQSLNRDCAGVYGELGRLYRDRLGRPKDALRACKLALGQHPFYAEPLEALVPKVWPVSKMDRDALWAHSGRMGPSRTAWCTRDALTDLAELQERLGDTSGAMETRIRLMMAVRLIEGTWANYRREPEKLWSLVSRLPAGTKLPPMPWFNVLSPAEPAIKLGPRPSTPRPGSDGEPAWNVVAPPGHRFDKLELTADMESKGEYGEVECYSLVGGKHTMVGRVQWHLDRRAGRERRTASFRVPADAQVLHFGVIGHVQVRGVVATATFVEDRDATHQR